VLLLLVLQASFLIHPMGYAVMMARAQAPLPVSIRALAKALAPYLGSQVLVIAVVFGYAPAVHFLDAQEAQKAPETEVDLDAQMRAMSDPAVAEGAVKPDSEIPAQRASGLQNR
jgi:hypothetical protein